MLLTDDNELRLIVFDKNLDRVGELNDVSSFIWPSTFAAFSTFELNCPATEENIKLLTKNRLLFPRGKDNDTIAFIEIVKFSRDDKGVFKITVKGRTIEKILMDRIIWGTLNYIDEYVSTIIYDIVSKNCINTEDENRIIPHLLLAVDEKYGDKISFQKTGGTVYESITSLLADNPNLGFKISFNPANKSLIFKVMKSNDRTRSSDNPIVFSTDMQDILTDSYYYNNQDEKNVALVAGEDSGENRKKVTVGNENLSGFDRKEMYIDARDLQSEKSTDGDSSSTENMTDEEYYSLLSQRGSDKLAENKEIENMECDLRQGNNLRYKFGIDFNVGDKVTVVDKEINKQVDIQITAVQEEISDKYGISMTFGYSMPTLYSRVKRDLANM